MLVSKADNIEFGEVGLEYPGYEGVFAKVLVGKPQGWQDYTMKLFEIKKGGHTDKHSHEYQHVMFVLDGKGIVEIDNVKYPVEKGSFVFFTPGIEHQISNAGDDVLRYTFTTTNYDVFISNHKA